MRVLRSKKKTRTQNEWPRAGEPDGGLVAQRGERLAEERVQHERHAIRSRRDGDPRWAGRRDQVVGKGERECALFMFLPHPSLFCAKRHRRSTIHFCSSLARLLVKKKRLHNDATEERGCSCFSRCVVCVALPVISLSSERMKLRHEMVVLSFSLIKTHGVFSDGVSSLLNTTPHPSCVWVCDPRERATQEEVPRLTTHSLA